MEVKVKLIEILNENGIYISPNTEESDIDLREYITDSMQFVSFIVAVEESLGIVFPNEMLLYDSIASLNGFSNTIESIMKGEYDYDPLEDDDYDEDDPYTDKIEE